MKLHVSILTKPTGVSRLPQEYMRKKKKNLSKNTITHKEREKKGKVRIKTKENKSTKIKG